MFGHGCLVVANVCYPRRVVVHLPGNYPEARMVPVDKGRVGVNRFLQDGRAPLSPSCAASCLFVQRFL
jgi:hypothetical protein